MHQGPGAFASGPSFAFSHQKDARDCLVRRGSHAVLAVNDCARGRACVPSGRLRPLTAPLRRAAGAPGNPARTIDGLKTMKTQTSVLIRSITAVRVPEGEPRSEVLPRHFAHHMVTVEDSIFMVMRRLVPEQHAALWHFYELSNGGFYMAPDLQAAQQVRNLITGDYREMSADAAGVAASLLAFRHLSTQMRSDVMVRHYFQLRDFAMAHAERHEIFGAID